MGTMSSVVEMKIDAFLSFNHLLKPKPSFTTTKLSSRFTFHDHNKKQTCKFKIRSQVGAEKQTASVDSRVKDIVWPSPDDEIVFWNKEFPHWDVSQQAPAEIEKDSDLMHIIHVTAEMAPIAKVGGLGDVVTGLARACLSRAHKVDIMLPFYECIQREQISELELITTYESYYDGNWVPTNAYRGVVSGIPVIFIQPSNNFFKGQNVYGGSYNELEAYLYFSRACLEWMQVTGTQPDIIHIHEWQAGSLPLLYWDMYHYLSLKKPRMVLTIHNMEHYGECRKEELSKCGLDGSLYATLDKAVDDRTIGHNPERLSLLKGGIVYSNAVIKTKASLELERFPYQSGDFLEYLTLMDDGHHVVSGIASKNLGWQGKNLQLLGTCTSNFSRNQMFHQEDSKKREFDYIVYSAIYTVSPTYLKETLCSGWLASTLILNRDKYYGVLNGIDTAMWNPATDVFLPSKFNARNTEGKKICKYYVQRGLGLILKGTSAGKLINEMENKVPLVVCITRLVAQKGLHLITHAIKQVEERGGQMIVLGKASDGRVQTEFEGLANLHNQGPSIRILLTYSEELSHMLYAAADMVLVPSIYEPCGLAQMIGMRYGTIPIVRKTGGLADTVFDMDDQLHRETANGFVFEGIDEGSLNWALDRAFSFYREKPEEWNTTIQKVMEIDNSWNNTAGKYIDIYNSVRVRC